jgi:hypothetical protein
MNAPSRIWATRSGISAADCGSPPAADSGLPGPAAVPQHKRQQHACPLAPKQPGRRMARAREWGASVTVAICCGAGGRSGASPTAGRSGSGLVRAAGPGGDCMSTLSTHRTAGGPARCCTGPHRQTLLRGSEAGRGRRAASAFGPLRGRGLRSPLTGARGAADIPGGRPSGTVRAQRSSRFREVPGSSACATPSCRPESAGAAPAAPPGPSRLGTHLGPDPCGWLPGRRARGSRA